MVILVLFDFLAVLGDDDLAIDPHLAYGNPFIEYLKIEMAIMRRMLRPQSYGKKV